MRKPHEKAVGLPPFLLALFASARRVRWPRKLDRATDSGRPLAALVAGDAGESH